MVCGSLNSAGTSADVRCAAIEALLWLQEQQLTALLCLCHGIAYAS